VELFGNPLPFLHEAHSSNIRLGAHIFHRDRGLVGERLNEPDDFLVESVPAFHVEDHQRAGRTAEDAQRHEDGGADTAEADDRLVRATVGASVIRDEGLA